MPSTRCPHCGKATFTFRGRQDVNTCPRCGRSLASVDPRETERAVREKLYGHGNGNGAERSTADQPRVASD